MHPHFTDKKKGPGGLKEPAENKKHSECVNNWHRTSVRQTADFYNIAVYQ